MAVAEALYPGELERRLRKAEAYLRTLLNKYGTRWVKRLGYDDALSEARIGAMRGIVAWILADGPAGLPGAAQIQTYILTGFRYHFGRSVAWYVGPVRVNVRAYESDTEAALSEVVIPDGPTTDGVAGFFPSDDPTEEADAAEERAVVVRHILAAADRCDSTGAFRKIIELRHGITSGVPLSFKEIGDRYGIRRQAAHARYHLAVKAVRETLGVYIDVPSELG